MAGRQRTTVAEEAHSTLCMVMGSAGMEHLKRDAPSSKQQPVEYGGCPKPCHGGIAMRCGLRRKKYAPAQSQRSICVKISAQSAVGEAREARRARAEDGDTQQPTDNTHVTNIY
jgi:hypothetical protein